jgi:hypothetical protein
LIVIDVGVRPSGQQAQALEALFETLDDTGESRFPDIESWLDQDEELVSVTCGDLVQPATEFCYAIVLTSKHLRAVSILDEMKLELADVKYIKWSGLWARLNIQRKTATHRLVFAISGRRWKRKARTLACEWSQL